MMNPWQLPTTACFGGKTYKLHADYRDVLEIFSYLDDPDLPEYLRWQVALALFYEEDILPEHQQQAMEYLAAFICCGKKEDGKSAPKLLDWQQDALTIIADVNKVAAQEIRALPFVHWWTFLAWFHAIGEGQLSTIVSIRNKLRQGKKLEKWEQEFYRENKDRVDMKKRYSQAEQQQRQALNALLG